MRTNYEFVYTNLLDICGSHESDPLWRHWFSSADFGCLMKRLLLAVLLVVTSATANGTSLIFGGLGIHFSGNDFNNWHRIIAVEHRDFVAGYFKNSYRRDSLFAGYRHRNYENGLFTYYTGYGVVTNYDDECFLYPGAEPCPFVSAHLKIKNIPFSPTINLLGESLSISIEVQIP